MSLVERVTVEEISSRFFAEDLPKEGSECIMDLSF